MVYDENNIFAKILRGEIPCHKIYEDEDTLVFLDIMPGTEGHALVVTKEKARDLKFAYKFRQLAKLVGALAQRRRDEKSEHFDFLQMMMDARDKETGAPMSDRELVDRWVSVRLLYR